MTYVGEDNVFGVQMVAFVDFDIIDGTNMGFRYPSDVNLGFSLQHLANCSLPDGAHCHQTDQSYIIIPSEDGPKYAIAFFRNKSDKDANRGAIQRALLIVSSFPHMHLFEQPAYELLEYSITDSDSETPELLLKRLYTAFKKDKKDIFTTSGLENSTHNTSVTVFTHPHNISVPTYYPPGHFNGISLLQLVLTLRENTMLIWYYLLLKKRILFVDDRAQAVGACCLASCMLIYPLVVDTNILSPYVTLPDVDRLLTLDSYVAGTTNILFYQKQAWFDVAFHLSGMPVVQTGKKPIKITKGDQLFIDMVLNEISHNPSEDWVRDQFEKYTLKLVYGLSRRQLSKKKNRILSGFEETKMFKNYVNSEEGKNKLLEMKKKPSTPTPERKNFFRTKTSQGAKKVTAKLAPAQKTLQVKPSSPKEKSLLSSKSLTTRKYRKKSNTVGEAQASFRRGFSNRTHSESKKRSSLSPTKKMNFRDSEDDWIILPDEYTFEDTNNSLIFDDDIGVSIEKQDNLDKRNVEIKESENQQSIREKGIEEEENHEDLLKKQQIKKEEINEDTEDSDTSDTSEVNDETDESTGKSEDKIEEEEEKEEEEEEEEKSTEVISNESIEIPSEESIEKVSEIMINEKENEEYKNEEKIEIEIKDNSEKEDNEKENITISEENENSEKEESKDGNIRE